MSNDSQDGLSRRTMFKAGATAGAAAVAGTVAAPAGGAAATGRASQATRPAGDLILHGGHIHTMNSRDTVARTVAIRDGRIVYVGGSEKAARRLFLDQPRMIDLRGRTVIPGIIDCHNHIVLMGNRPGHHTPLENAYSIADVAKTYAARSRTAPAGEFINTIGGFHFNQFAERRLPTLSELDAALPRHPAYISVGFSGPSVTNTLGKAFFEQASALGEVGGQEGLEPVAVAADGAIAAGLETGRATLALRRTLTFEQRKRGVRDAMAYAASMGVTTHLDQGAFQATDTPGDGAASEDNYSMHLPFLAVYNDGGGSIRLRINFLHMETDPALPGLTQRLLNAYPFFGDDLVRTGGIGEFLAAGLGPTWLDAARRVAAAGWRAEVHSLTTTDFQTEIQGFEAVNAQTPITDLRWVVAHVPFITREYVDRLHALGGGVNLTGWRYLFSPHPPSPRNPQPRAGTAASAGPPFRMIVDSGIHNAWFLGGEDSDKLGTIEVGKLGDLVVLNRDYFTIPTADLRQVRSVLTVLGGKVVHT